MPVGFADRVQETTSATGTGTVTLAGAVPGFQSFSSAFSANGASTQLYYALSDGTNWEVGIGTYTVSGGTLSRQYVLSSSNSGALVSFPGPTTNAWNDLPALLADGIPQSLSTALLVPVNQQMVFATDLQPTNGDILVNGLLTGIGPQAITTTTTAAVPNGVPIVYQQGGVLNVATGTYPTFALAAAAAYATSVKVILIDGSLGTPTTVAGTLATPLDYFTLLPANDLGDTLTIVDGTVWTFAQTATSLRIGAGLQCNITASAANTISLTGTNQKLALILEGVSGGYLNNVSGSVFLPNPSAYPNSVYGAYLNFNGTSSLAFILVGTTATLTIYMDRGSVINANGSSLFNYAGTGGLIRVWVGPYAYLGALAVGGANSACVLDITEGDPSAQIVNMYSGAGVLYFGTVSVFITVYPVLPLLASALCTTGFSAAGTVVLNPGTTAAPAATTTIGTPISVPYRLRSATVAYTLTTGSGTITFVPHIYVNGSSKWTGATTTMTANSAQHSVAFTFNPVLGSAGDVVTLVLVLAGTGTFTNISNVQMTAGS